MMLEVPPKSFCDCMVLTMHKHHSCSKRVRTSYIHRLQEFADVPFEQCFKRNRHTRVTKFLCNTTQHFPAQLHSLFDGLYRHDDYGISQFYFTACLFAVFTAGDHYQAVCLLSLDYRLTALRTLPLSSGCWKEPDNSWHQNAPSNLTLPRLPDHTKALSEGKRRFLRCGVTLCAAHEAAPVEPSQTKPNPSQAKLLRGCGLAWDPDSHRAVTAAWCWCYTPHNSTTTGCPSPQPWQPVIPPPKRH